MSATARHGEARRRRRRPRRVEPHTLVLWALSLFTVVFLVAPTVFVLLVSVSPDRFVTFPPSGVTLHWYRQVAGEFAAATWLSVQLAFASMIVSIVLGLPAAYALVRGRPRGGAALDALFRSPLQIPHVVIGIGFLQYYLLIARASGVELLSTFAALLTAHCVVTVPFVVSAVATGLASSDPGLEDAAQGLGRGRVATFFLVTLPLLKPAVFAGAFFAFLVSFDNLPVSLFLAVAGQTPLPVAMFFEAEFSNTPTLYAMSAIISTASAGAILLFDRIVGLRSVTNPTP
jgi:putative spermidine/putrescine transport system permease protein